MGEFNPEHPLVRNSRELWQKYIAVLMSKMDTLEFQITQDDIVKLETRFAGEMPCVVIQDEDGKFMIRLVGETKAREMMLADQIRHRGGAGGPIH